MLRFCILLQFFMVSVSVAAVSNSAQTDLLSFPAMDLVVMEETGLSDSEVKEMTRVAVDIFKQCGVTSNTRISIERKTGSGKNGAFEIFDRNSENSIRSEMLKNTFTNPIRVFFITRFIDLDFSAGRSYAEWSDIENGPENLVMKNSVWIATDTLKELNQDKSKLYNTLAHELSHVLTGYGQHNGDVTENLLAIWSRRNNFILPADCAKIRMNPLLTKL